MGSMCIWLLFVLLEVRPSRLKTPGPSSTTEPQESPDKFVSFCETETFHATCAVDEVIVITHARYGRMRISRCVKLDYGHLGCVADVIELADSRCSGRRRCEIRIPDSEFAKYKPCPDDLKPYLEIGHKCVRVQTSTDFCTYPQATPVTTSQAGHLASLVTEMTGCGGVTTPWVIEVNPGQVVRLTLYDFGVVRTKKGLTRPTSTQCHTYAILREPGQQQQNPGPGGVIRTVRNVTVCGGSMRQSVVYVTVTNRLEIGLVRNDNLIYGPHFMFEYHAIGCPDLPMLHNAWYIRSGDSLTVKCNFSKDVHQMRCKDNTWVGDKWNCTGIHSAANVDKLAKAGMSIPYGLSVLIILVIALAIGAFVLCIGLLFLRRRATGSCVEGESPSPVTPYANKHFATSSLVRNLTGSVALHPDKLPWKNTLVGHYGTNTVDGFYARCLSTKSGDRTHTSPTRTFPPAPYSNLRRNLPCGCSALWEGAEMSDVTSCALAHDRVKGDGGSSPLTEYFVLEDRKQRAYASSILQLNLLRKDHLDAEAEELEQRCLGAKRARPTSLATLVDHGHLSTSADVTAVPEIVSDCHLSSKNDVSDSPVSNDDDTL